MIAASWDDDARRPWGAEEHRRAIDEATAAYVEVLDLLVPWLNETHQAQFSRRFWEIVSYRWLTLHVRRVAARSHTARLLAAESREVPAADPPPRAPADDWTAENWGLFSASFNHWLLGCAGRAYNLPIEESRTAFDGSSRPGRRLPGRIVISAGRAMQMALADARRKTRVELLRLPIRGLESDLVERSGLSASPFDSMLRCDPTRRRRFLDLTPSPPSSPLVRAVLDSARRSIPEAYVERFSSALGMARRMRRFRGVKAIVATSLPHLVERIWVALLAEEGAPLVFVQHGGGYGESHGAPWEGPERRVSDRYVSWGWRGDRVTALPSPRLAALREAGVSPPTTAPRILWLPRMRRRYPTLESFCDRGTRFQSDLLRRLSASARARICLRLRKGQDAQLQAGWCDDPRVALDDGTRPIGEALRDSSFVVLDYPFSTTTAECCAVEVPFLIAAEPGRFAVADRARGTYEELFAAGLATDSAARAAALIERLLSSDGSRSERRRGAVERYQREHALMADDVAAAWSAFLRRLT